MKLVPKQELSQWDRPWAYAESDAIDRLKRVLDRDEDIEGLERMRASLSVDLEHKILDQLKTGQWLLIKQEIDIFQHPIFESAAAKIRIPSAPLPRTAANYIPAPYRPEPSIHTHDQHIVFKDQDGELLDNIPYIIKNAKGQTIEGWSDLAGRTKIVSGGNGESIRCLIGCHGELP